MKFINTINDIKVGYIYRVFDEDFRTLIKVTEELSTTDSDLKFDAEQLEQYDLKYTEFSIEGELWSITAGLVSDVKEDDPEFNNDMSSAFYEIGTEDEHPELFL